MSNIVKVGQIWRNRRERDYRIKNSYYSESGALCWHLEEIGPGTVKWELDSEFYHDKWKLIRGEDRCVICEAYIIDDYICDSCII